MDLQVACKGLHRLSIQYLCACFFCAVGCLANVNQAYYVEHRIFLGSIFGLYSLDIARNLDAFYVMAMTDDTCWEDVLTSSKGYLC